MELEALRSVFEGSRSLVVGALKSHIGHSEGASGIMSCIKSLLCLRMAAMPPNLHLTQVIDGHLWALIPSQLMPLTPERVLRVGVSSFGFGGSICHAIFEHGELKAGQRVHGVDARESKGRQGRVRFWPAHPLLGEQLESTEVRFCSEINLDKEHVHLKDHQVNGQIIFPAEGYLDMMLTAARFQGACQCGSVHVTDVTFLRMLALPSNNALFTSVQQQTVPWLVTVSSGERTFASGRLVCSECDVLSQRPPLLQEAELKMSSAEIYSVWPEYGPSYRLIAELELDRKLCVARASLLPPARFQQPLDASRAAPAGLLDAALQVLARALLQDQNLKGPLVPSRIGSVRLFRTLSCEAYEAVSWWDADAHGDGCLRGHVELLQGQHPVASLLNCEFRRLPPADLKTEVPHLQVQMLDPTVVQMLVPSWEEAHHEKCHALRRLSSSGASVLQTCLSRVTVSSIGEKHDVHELWLSHDQISDEQVRSMFEALPGIRDFSLSVYFWPFVPDLDVDVLVAVELSCQQLLAVAKALSTLSLHVCQFVVGTVCAVPVAAGSQVNLAHSGLTGMARSLKAERPSWNVVQVDFDQRPPMSTIDVCNLNEPILVLRKQKVLALRLQPWVPCTSCAEQLSHSAARSFDAGDHVLITGGLGGRAWFGYHWGATDHQRGV